MLGRFPRRNRFISDYIFDKTGVRRSPKQVGSRLQQLRESCTDTQLLDLLSPFRKPVYRAPSQCDSTLSSPISSAGFFPSTSAPTHTIIYIDILPEGSPDKTRSGTSPSPWSDDGEVIHVSDYPRRLKSINPTTSYSTPKRSRWGLVLDQPHQRSRFLYSAQLVPKYWKVILDSPDPTRFTIFQEVYKAETSAVLFSATYKFSYRHSTANHPSSYSGSCDARLDVPRKGMASSAAPLPLPGARYPIYSNDSSWNSPPLDPHGNSHLQRYPSQSNDSSVAYFHTELPIW
ncbi:TEA domain-containing protein [Mycena sanguinolenta]|uniref:TEA domain-containing protein n=1 Tax=Mycena sanguinolenta TaxID=230812 RepID=A0A8H6XJB9_9AGAR|nr:TEA domain-containing protein [Mycena sanguinolenta]